MERALFAIAMTLTGASAAAANDPLLGLYPTAQDVPGLAASGDSKFCGGGDDLTTFYDGGYLRFVKAGVLKASRRYYTLDGATVEIVVHQVSSPQAARAFLASLCQDIKSKVEGWNKTERCAAVASGTAYGFVAAGPYLTSVSFDKEDAAKLRALLEASGHRMNSHRR